MFLPVGANYWPASCGVDMWVEWPVEEMRSDLAAMQGKGLNTIRFFFRWPDFESRPGSYEEAAFQRLREFLGWCREYDIAAMPTLFVGFMSGGFFFPEGKQGKNLFADPSWRETSVAYATKAAKAMKGFEDVLLAVDHGNEISSMTDSWSAGEENLRAWSGGVSAAIRAVLPQVEVINGLDHNQVVENVGWTFANQEGCTLFSMHGYPVPGWWPVAFDGMGDPLCRELLPFCVAVARAHGPVLLQEFGTIIGGGPEQVRGYLEAILPRLQEQGANGFLWWCLRDIVTDRYPYTKHGIEGRLGLLDDHRQIKPGREALLEVSRQVPEMRPGVALYWPNYVKRHRENPGNEPGPHFRSQIPVATGLRLAGEPYRVVREGRLPDPGEAVLWVAGSSLTSGEIQTLRRWVEKGGQLVWQGLGFRSFDRAAEKLLGAVPVDVRGSSGETFAWGNREWHGSVYPAGMLTEFAPTTADVLAVEQRGLPMVVQNRFGSGRLLGVVPDMGASFAAEPADKSKRTHWLEWARLVLKTLASE